MIEEVSFVVPLFATRWAIKRGLKECIEFYAKHYLKNFTTLFNPRLSAVEPKSSIFDYIEDFNAND